MPPVKKRKKPAPKKATSTRRGKAKTSTPAEVFRGALARFWSGFVTYAVVGVTTIALVTALMLAAGGYFHNIDDRINKLTSSVAQAAGFTVSRVYMRGGDEVSNTDILNALSDEEEGSVIGRSLLNLDVQEMRRAVEELAWVRAAAVQKFWPDTVHITIIERTPVALWQDNKLDFYLIDAEGARLAYVEDTESIGLPVLTGTDDPSTAISVLTALSERPELYKRVAAVVSVEDRRFDLRFRNDFTAKLPETDIAEALARLEGLGAGTGKLSKTLKYLDLRDPRWAYFRPKSS